MKKITVIADFNEWTGTGLQAVALVHALRRDGWQTYIKPSNVELCPSVEDNVLNTTDKIIGLPLYYKPVSCLSMPKEDNAVAFTMWETTKLPREYVKVLNCYTAVLVPSAFCLAALLNSGVTVPVTVCSHGFDSDVFNVDESVVSHCVFATAGRSVHGRDRKGIDKVVSAFERAFACDVPDVQLRVKTFSDCSVRSSFNPHIQFISECFTKVKLARFYRESTAFVSASRCEGFGLHQLEVQACGRVLIAPVYGGLTDFCDTKAILAVRYHEVPVNCDEFYRTGKWAEVSEDSLVEQMQWVYAHKQSAVALGLCAASSVAHLTLTKTTKQTLNTLLEYA